MLDEALGILGGFGPDLRNGMSSHGPMVAEALCALGRPDAVMPWIERHRAEFTLRPRLRDRIDPAHWRYALAKEDRFSDWSALFAEELANARWQDVLDTWVSRLARGICANATHGVIRVGHAARSLGAAVTPVRTAELADALASWASTYQELPTSRIPAVQSFRPLEALATVELQPPEDRVFTGTIVSSLAGLAGFPAFAPVIDRIDSNGDPSDLVTELSELFARVLLDNVQDTLTAIVLTHGVTSVAAFGNLLPHIADATARSALPFAWQSACALYVTFASRRVSERPLEPSLEDAETLIERAVAHGDEHVIKLAEACLGTSAGPVSPVLSAAVSRVLELLPPA